MRLLSLINTSIGILLWLTTATARADDFVEINSISNLNLGVWQAAGSLSTTEITCVASADTDRRNPRRRDRNYPYNLKIESLDGPEFRLYKDSNTSNTGDAVIAVEFEHRDVVDPSGFELLTAGLFDGHAHDGQFRDCRDTGDNSEIRITLHESELQQKQSGFYSGNFRVTVIGGESGTETDSTNFSVSLEVVNNSPDAVKISRLDNAVFPPFSGSGDRTWDERFCIYSNAPSGAYRLSISGQHQDQNSGFRLKNTTQESYIDFSLAFADSGVGTATTPVGAAPLSGTGNTSSEDCGGSDNATLSFSIAEQAMSSAMSGFYSDTLVLVVEPE